MRGRLVTLLVVGALAGCGGGATPPNNSGAKGRLYGTVTRGPTAPVCRAGVPCSEPASGAKLLFEQVGHVIATALVAQDGSYSVSLPPGSYGVALALQRPTIGRGLEPSMVLVVAGQARHVAFQIDTGIR